MKDFFPAYKAAYEAYVADLEQLSAIGTRLVANARASKGGMKQLNTLEAQIDKLPESMADAKKRFDGKIDATDAAIVDRFRALCAYAIGTGQGDAGINYLYGECQAFDRAKGNFELRRSLFAGIGDVADSVADATKNGRSSASPVLNQLNSLEGEEQTRFYRKHRSEVHAAHEQERP